MRSASFPVGIGREIAKTVLPSALTKVLSAKTKSVAPREIRDPRERTLPGSARVCA
jgi:hypothetical protein